MSRVQEACEHRGMADIRHPSTDRRMILELVPILSSRHTKGTRYLAIGRHWKEIYGDISAL